MDEIERLQNEIRQLHKDKIEMAKIIGGADGLLKSIAISYNIDGAKASDVMPLYVIDEWQAEVDEYFKVGK